MGCVLCPLFGADPEFALVVTGEQGPVFLRFMLENRQLLSQHDFRTQRHGPLDFVRLIFLPGPAVQPDFGPDVLAFDNLQGLNDCLGTHAMSSVRIGKIARHVNLIGVPAPQ